MQIWTYIVQKSHSETVAVQRETQCQVLETIGIEHHPIYLDLVPFMPVAPLFFFFFVVCYTTISVLFYLSIQHIQIKGLYCLLTQCVVQWNPASQVRLNSRDQRYDGHF